MATASNSGAFNDDGTRALGGPAPQPTNTPDAFIKEQVNGEIKRMQDVFEQQWAMIEKQKKYLGEQQTANLLNQLTFKAKNRVMLLKAEGQKKMDMLGTISKLKEQGMLNDADPTQRNGSVDKMLWSVAAGDKMAESMFPQQADSVESAYYKQYGKLSAQEDRVQKDLKRFRVVPAVPENHWKPGKQAVPEHIETLDPQATGKDDKGYYIGVWSDPSNQSEVKQEMLGHQRELKRVRDAMAVLREGGDLSGISGIGTLRKIAQKSMSGEYQYNGTLGDQINMSLLEKKLNKTPKKKESARPNVRVKHIASGQTGTIPADEFNSQEYERLQ